MGNDGEFKSTLTLAEEATVGLLFALSEASELPARPWPLVAACQVLARQLPAASPDSAHLGLATDSVRGESVVTTWMLQLAEAGQFQAGVRWWTQSGFRRPAGPSGGSLRLTTCRQKRRRRGPQPLRL